MTDIYIENDIIQTNQIEKMLFRKESDGKEYLIPIKHITRITGESKSSTIYSSDGLNVRLSVEIELLRRAISWARKDDSLICVYNQSEIDHFRKIQSEEILRIRSIIDDVDFKMSHVVKGRLLSDFDTQVEGGNTRYDHYLLYAEEQSLQQAWSHLYSAIEKIESIDVKWLSSFNRLQSAIEKYKTLHADCIIKEILEDAYHWLQLRLIEELDGEEPYES